MVLSKSERIMLESTLYNLQYNCNYAGREQVLLKMISLLTDAELIDALNDFIAAT